MSKTDLSNEKFGRLSPQRIVGKTKNKSNLWECLCDCGKLTVVPAYALRRGQYVSCGCKRQEDRIRRMSTPGIQKELAKHRDFTGDKNPNWNGGASFAPYCEKFTKQKREEVREAYGRKCVFCGKPEAENISKSGKHQKLSVHHLDRDKEQGCNGKKWQLVPVCMCCHSKAHPKVK